MELIVITTLCVLLSIMVTPCFSLQIFQVQSEKQVPHDHQLSVPTVLPRKLRLIEETTLESNEGKDFVSYNRPTEALSGTKHHKDEGTIHTKRGTWQDWKERADMSQFFTMDYSHVRRRRPIHNKSVTSAP